MSTRVLRLEIDEELIGIGRKNDCRNCPGALALKAAAGPDAHAIHAGPVFLMFDDPAGYWQGQTPVELRDWMYRFDDGKPVQPLSIECELKRPDRA